MRERKREGEREGCPKGNELRGWLDVGGRVEDTLFEECSIVFARQLCVCSDRLQVSFSSDADFN